MTLSVSQSSKHKSNRKKVEIFFAKVAIVPDSCVMDAKHFCFLPVDPKRMRRGLGSSAVLIFLRRKDATKIMANTAIL